MPPWYADASLLRSSALTSIVAKGMKYQSYIIWSESGDDIVVMDNIKRVASTWLQVVTGTFGKHT